MIINYCDSFSLFMLVFPFFHFSIATFFLLDKNFLVPPVFGRSVGRSVLLFLFSPNNNTIFPPFRFPFFFKRLFYCSIYPLANSILLEELLQFCVAGQDCYGWPLLFSIEINCKRCATK